MFDGVLELEHRVGVPILHETHRGRSLCNPWSTARILHHAGLDLKIIADYAHFTCSAEMQPWEQDLVDVLRELTPHVHHLHARVGHENSPQVPDPFNRQWQPYTECFEQFWVDIWRHMHMARAGQSATATPEAGPPTYQQTNLVTGLPCADVEDINVRMGARLQQLCSGVGTPPDR